MAELTFERMYKSDAFKGYSFEKQQDTRKGFFDAFVADQIGEEHREGAFETFQDKYPIEGESFNVLSEGFKSAKDLIPPIDLTKEVKDFKWRARYGALDNDQERVDFLKKEVGPLGYTKYGGKFLLTPGGAESKFGIKTDKSIPIDAEGSWNKYDVADLSAHAGEVGLGTAAALATGGAGVVPGLLATGLSSAVGKGGQELYERKIGLSNKSDEEIKGESFKSGAYGMGGEGAIRGLSPIGRYFSGPNLTRDFTLFKPRGGVYSQVDKPLADISEYAISKNIIPSITQATGRNKIVGFLQNLSTRIFGNKNEYRNAENIFKESERLTHKAGAGQITSKTKLQQSIIKSVTEKENQLVNTAKQAKHEANNEIRKNLGGIQNALGRASNTTGQKVSDLIRTAKGDFDMRASEMYGAVDKIAGSAPMLSSGHIKLAAQKILEKYPKSGEGRAFVPDGVSKYLNDIVKMDNKITFTQAQNIRSELGRIAYSPEFKNTQIEHYAYMLKDATNATMERGSKSFTMMEKMLPGQLRNQLPRPKAYKLLKEANDFYASQINKFDNVEISRLARDVADGKGIEADEVAGFLAGLGDKARVKRVMGIIPEQDRGSVSRLVFDHMLTKADDGVGSIDPSSLYSMTKEMGSGFNAIFGKESPQILEYIKQLRVANKKFDPNILKTGPRATQSQSVKEALEREVASITERDLYVQNNMVKMIQNGEYSSVVDVALNPRKSQFVKDLMGVMNEKQQGQFKFAASEQIARELLDTTTRPGQTLINATGYSDKINKLTTGMRSEDNVLHQIFGKAHTKELIKFSNMVKTIGSRKEGSGLVENYLALHPIANLGRLMRLKVMTHILADRDIVNVFLKGFDVVNGKNIPGAVALLGAKPASQIFAQQTKQQKDRGFMMMDEAFDRAIEAAGESGILEKIQGINTEQ
jgi:hypothetical protein